MCIERKVLVRKNVTFCIKQKLQQRHQNTKSFLCHNQSESETDFSTNGFFHHFFLTNLIVVSSIDGDDDEKMKRNWFSL